MSTSGKVRQRTKYTLVQTKKLSAINEKLPIVKEASKSTRTADDFDSKTFFLITTFSVIPVKISSSLTELNNYLSKCLSSENLNDK